MRAYVIRRLLLVIPTVILTSLLIFFLMHLLPGDIVSAMMVGSGDVGEFDREMVERKLGLDAPLLTQYGRWVGVVRQPDGNFNGIFQGGLGDSWWYGMSVTKLLESKWPVTLQLGIMGIIIGQLVALSVGIYSAIRQDKWGDYVGRSFAILAISIPGFWLATLIIVYPSIWWDAAPTMMFIRFTDDPIGNLKMLVIPSMLLGLGMCGYSMRMTRTMMLEVLRQDYIRTAWAKGLRERVVVIRHALKNALIPVVTMMGLSLRLLIGGVVIIEQIFCLPGMGRLILGALIQRDYPLITGIMVVFAGVLVVLNLMVDLTYAYLDPRVRY